MLPLGGPGRDSIGPRDAGQVRVARVTNRAGRSLALLAGLVLMAPEGIAAVPLDVQVKAAFLPKFAAYVNWPAGALGPASEPVMLCVIGRDPFGRALDAAVAGQRVDQRLIQVRRLDSTIGADHCNIAFLGGSARQSPGAMQEALRGQPILTVTDTSEGAGRGIVHFAVKEGRVRFHIDDALAARNNLTLSARLLSLALSVKSRTRLPWGKPSSRFLWAGSAKGITAKNAG